MDHAARRYTLHLLALVLVPLALLVAANWVVDPFGVFQSGFLPIDVEPVQSYRKIEYLKEHRSDYTGIMLGSSAIGFTPPALIERHLPGSRFYNLWTSSATQYENLAHLRYVVESFPGIKTVYLQIDITLGMSEYRHSNTTYARRLHPDLTGGGRINFFWDYLTVFSWDRLERKVGANWTGRQDAPVTDFEHGGYVVAPVQEARIAADPEAYIESIADFRRKSQRSLRDLRGGQNMAALKEMKTLCEARGIRFIVFTHPEHQVDMDRFIFKEYASFLRQLASVTEFWDFSGYTKISRQDILYYEPGHYRPKISEFIAQRILGGDPPSSSDSFGVIVNTDSIDSRIASLAKQFEDRDGLK